ncbi:hypothetical protein CQA53_03675 [Helicobacter didelphidarum]|uniref:Uncharacterized protein n=1 Tax=Helicobacter didelphidarum TaxID=2040648 RepID=A0A3D8INQ9_9HELI|nr:hypothetical protein [Helicobacter didelphidarum]RDU66546.1 hypothetical protein CQA53_03675 [Helicobacter didelphidarum]
MGNKKDNKKPDFLIDLPVVFSVVKLEDLVQSANSFYGTNVIVPKPGSSFDSRTEKGVVHKFHLYKLTIRRLDEDEKRFKKNVNGFETLMENMGIFTNLYEIMTYADTITVFSNLEEADIFLRACLKADSNITTKSAFLFTDTEIEGLETNTCPNNDIRN